MVARCCHTSANEVAGTPLAQQDREAALGLLRGEPDGPSAGGRDRLEAAAHRTAVALSDVALSAGCESGLTRDGHAGVTAIG
jgi:hypothetical protein